MWLRGRKLRGFLTTAVWLSSLLFGPHAAFADATARFTDVPSADTPARTATLRVRVLPSEAEAAAPAVSVPVVDSPLPAPNPAQPGFTRRLALSHFERAKVLDQRGDIAQALHEYTESIGVDSTFGAAYLGLGALRERMGDPREAELVYSEAVRISDTRARALLQRSRLRRGQGQSAQALADLEAAVELDANPTVLQELARDYVELHAWTAALAVFRRIAARAAETQDSLVLQTARLEVRALRVLAAETDPSQTKPPPHDWVGRALRSIARR